MLPFFTPSLLRTPRVLSLSLSLSLPLSLILSLLYYCSFSYSSSYSLSSSSSSLSSSVRVFLILFLKKPSRQKDVWSGKPSSTKRKTRAELSLFLTHTHVPVSVSVSVTHTHPTHVRARCSRSRSRSKLASYLFPMGISQVPKFYSYGVKVGDKGCGGKQKDFSVTWHFCFGLQDGLTWPLSTEHVRCDVTLNVKIKKKQRSRKQRTKKLVVWRDDFFFLRAHTVYVRK